MSGCGILTSLSSCKISTSFFRKKCRFGFLALDIQGTIMNSPKKHKKTILPKSQKIAKTAEVTKITKSLPKSQKNYKKKY